VRQTDLACLQNSLISSHSLIKEQARRHSKHEKEKEKDGI
jgi:hypothetical protein